MRFVPLSLFFACISLAACGPKPSANAPAGDMPGAAVPEASATGVTYMRLNIKPNESLLGPSLTLPSTRLAMRPPKGWRVHAAEELAQAKAQMEKELAANPQKVALADAPVFACEAPDKTKALVFALARPEKVPASPDAALEFAQALVKSKASATPPMPIRLGKLQLARVTETSPQAVTVTFIIELPERRLGVLTLFCPPQQFDILFSELMESVLGSLGLPE